ncbi:MAG: hypothetical protein QXN40_04975 [Candidatus Bathyarchaeia archaeon]
MEKVFTRIKIISSKVAEDWSPLAIDLAKKFEKEIEWTTRVRKEKFAKKQIDKTLISKSGSFRELGASIPPIVMITI